MSDWISVKERLPEDDVEVLIFGPKTMYIGHRSKGTWFAAIDDEEWVAVWETKDWKITHWQPLPEPPKEHK